MAKEAIVKSINDVAPRDVVVPDLVSATDVVDVELELKSFRKRTGEFSDFYIMECAVVATGDTIYISAGSYMVEMQLMVIRPREDLPLRFKFVLEGRSYFMG